MLHRSSSLEVWFIVFSVNSGLGSALIHSSVFLLCLVIFKALPTG